MDVGTVDAWDARKKIFLVKAKILNIIPNQKKQKLQKKVKRKRLRNVKDIETEIDQGA